MRREFTRGGIFLCTCASVQHGDNWRGTPGHWPPLNPSPLPFKPTPSALGARFAHMCVYCARTQCSRWFYVRGYKGRASCLCEEAHLYGLPLHSRWHGSGRSSRSFSCAINDSGLIDDLWPTEKLSPFWRLFVWALFFVCLTFTEQWKAHLKFCFFFPTSLSSHKP